MCVQQRFIRILIMCKVYYGYVIVNQIIMIDRCFGYIRERAFIRATEVTKFSGGECRMHRVIRKVIYVKGKNYINYGDLSGGDLGR